MTGPKLFEMLADLLTSVSRSEPKAACHPCVDERRRLRRLYWAFTTPQRCAFCDKEFEPRDVVGFEDA